MLEELHIRNYALIDTLTVRFTKGLTILSGETGAGKSILVGALGMVLGAKVSSDVIRTGSEEAEVTAVIRIAENRDAEEWLRQRDISHEEGLVILRRILRRNGRGASYIQNVPVTVADLQEFTSFLIDLHGQHEHQSLFHEENHRKFLDRFAGISDRVEEFFKKFQELAHLRKKKEELLQSEKERFRELEYLRYAVEEIEQAKVREGEEEELEQEKKILLSHEKLVKTLDEVISELSAGREGVALGIRRGLNLLQSLIPIDASLGMYQKRLETVYYEILDIVESLKAYAEKRVFHPERLEKIEERLGILYRLEKKYGPTLGDVFQFKEKSEERIRELEATTSEMESIDQAVRNIEKQLQDEAGKISEIRKQEASRLQNLITEALTRLGMKKIRFEVSLSRKESSPGVIICGPYGYDTVSFLISPNPGEPLKPLKEIASGGEVSRIMLAIKTVLAEADSIGCLIFDEVDAGIGGEAAVVVGDYLHTLSRSKQVLVITHLASLAARGDQHFKVMKLVDGDRTRTDIKSIKDDERIREIARMLSGEPEGKVSLIHAEELLTKYNRG
ncbi:MAG: DNA repair protein RecN [Spirochaetes bacterium]|nr:DNA repair protein RecN [Spirochaetota bacterium]